jgi:AcrR family transcriptional regulator
MSSKQAAREQRILEAALPLFTRYGFDKTSMDDIARAAGVSKGAVYLHFTGKQALFDRLVIQESERLLEGIIDNLDRDPAGYSIFNVYRFSLVGLLESPLLGALYTRDRRVLGEYAQRLTERNPQENIFSFGETFVRHFQAAGMIDPSADPTALSYVLMALRYGLIRIDEIMPPPQDFRAIGEMVAHMLGSAFGTPGGDNDAAKQALRALFAQGLTMLRTLSGQQQSGNASQDS